jgi:hypothetical protein
VSGRSRPRGGGLGCTAALGLIAALGLACGGSTSRAGGAGSSMATRTSTCPGLVPVLATFTGTVSHTATVAVSATAPAGAVPEAPTSAAEPKPPPAKPKPEAKPEPEARPKAEAKPKPEAKSEVPTVAEQAARLHAPWAAVLARFVDERGRVDYAGLRRDRTGLDAYVAALAALPSAEVEAWPSRERLALWINAYNALTLRLILDEAPRTSIRDLDRPWDRPRFVVLGAARTLNDIEHRIVRVRWREPRIHMALVCAARGCPILMNRPYSGTRLEAQLAESSRRYLASPAGARAEPGRASLALSRIFEWYGEDFVDPRDPQRAKLEDAVRRFVATWGRGEVKARAEAGAPLEWIDYDWSLNQR